MKMTLPPILQISVFSGLRADNKFSFIGCSATRGGAWVCIKDGVVDGAWTLKNCADAIQEARPFPVK